MPPRLNKRQQRELEELSALRGAVDDQEEKGASSEDEVEPEAGLGAGGTGFAALLQPDENDDESAEEDGQAARPKSKKSKKKKKKAGGSSLSATTSVPAPATPAAESPAASSPGPSKKDRKAAKKAKAKEKDTDDLDKVLAELSVKYPDLKASAAPSSSPSASLSSLLTLTPSHLDPTTELRRLFGSKVVPPNSSKVKVRSVLARPKDGWWPAKHREGLSLRALDGAECARKRKRWGWEEDGEEKWWTVEYDRRYKSVTAGFVTTVLAGDPEGFYRILGKLPYHADTLLQLAEAYRYRDEHAQATDFTERAMFAYERAFVGVSLTNGGTRLDFDHVENRPFFLAIHRVILDLQRRGYSRTAFEFAKLLYSLDPSADPHGALMHLDTLALKVGSGAWLVDVFDLFRERAKDVKSKRWQGRMDPSVLPGWIYSRALALRMKEDSEKSEHHESSEKALREAIVAFPSVVLLLADKADIALSGEVRGHRSFRIQTASSLQSENAAHLLSHLYALRASALWKQNSTYGAWLASTAQSLLPTIISVSPSSPTLIAFSKLFSTPTLAYSIYRHVIILESSSATYRTLFSFLPRDVLAGPGQQLACDPLPPPTRVTEYNEAYFEGVGAWEEGMSRRGRREEERVRRYLQAILDANPQLAQRFPGGLAQLLQVAGQMGEGGLEELFFNVAQEMPAVGAERGGGMPGGMPGEVEMRFLDEDEEVVGETQDGGRERGGEATVRQGREREQEEGEGDGDEEDEEDEEAAPMPVRIIRNFLNRFWGGPPADEDEESSSSDEEVRPLQGGDVD